MTYWALKALLGPILWVVFRPSRDGLEHVPRRGGAILACNHLSFCDSIFLPLVLRRKVAYLAKAEYFERPGLVGRLQTRLLHSLGQVPLDRSGGSASSAALLAGCRVLASGRLLGIYPEGTRSPDGRLYRGKTGAVRLALEAGVPVIPVAVIGTDKVQPLGKVIPRVHRVRVRFGPPLDVTGTALAPASPDAGTVEGQAPGAPDLRVLTDRLMHELQRLSGQEYVDVYADEVKAEMVAKGQLDPKLGGSGGKTAGKRPLESDTPPG
ncbi:MAG: 1-acyl-sn-glycerol-3-phosphate acyltransferase [Actinomycetota bacterium]|nr:1-acyl-sn-glycerol-3-phosphate acyltransferase [Actinomycetota bacterium]